MTAEIGKPAETSMPSDQHIPSKGGRLKLQGKGRIPVRRALAAGTTAVAGMLAVVSLAWACTAPVGGTFYIDGTSAKTVARGTTISAFATGAEPGFAYQLVIGDPNGPSQHVTHACMDVLFRVSSTLRFANEQGVLPRTTGPAGSASTPTGTYQLCFRSTGSEVGTGAATITLV